MDLKVWKHCTPNSGHQSSGPTSIKKQKTQQPIQKASDPRSKDSTPGQQTFEREPPGKPQIGSRKKRRGEAEQNTATVSQNQSRKESAKEETLTAPRTSERSSIQHTIHRSRTPTHQSKTKRETEHPRGPDHRRRKQVADQNVSKPSSG